MKTVYLGAPPDRFTFGGIKDFLQAQEPPFVVNEIVLEGGVLKALLPDSETKDPAGAIKSYAYKEPN